MDAIHDWIALILSRAFDEYLEVTDSKYLPVKDHLSNRYIYCVNVEFAQLVEVRASLYMQTDIPLSGKVPHMPTSSPQPQTRHRINMLPS